MDDAYFRWLIDLLGDEYLENHYQKLLDKLYSREFIWKVEYDENRAKYGLRLRRIFAEEMGENGKNGPKMAKIGRLEGCSVLEMLIGLAKNCEDDILWNPNFGDHTGPIFWEMLENLGLDIYDDYNWFEGEVDRILDVFLERKYDRHGNGNVFQLKSADPRKMDLWLQLNQYLVETGR